MKGESVTEWLGKEVKVAYKRGGTDDGQFGCTLVGANELGIVVRYEKNGPQTRFLPWSSVGYLHLDTSAKASQRRGAGFVRPS